LTATKGFRDEESERTKQNTSHLFPTHTYVCEYVLRVSALCLCLCTCWGIRAVQSAL